MAKYTTTIKELMKNNFDFQLTEYPIFDESYRETLNNNILNHFYMCEIGFETAALFRFYLKQKMNEIMPYYNILYNNQKILIENIKDNVNFEETLKRDVKNETSSTSSSNSKGKNVFQDTPQGPIKDSDIDNYEYATNINLSKNDINDNSNGKGSSTEDYVKKIIGNNGSKYNLDILKDLKNNLMNIDLMIINELYDLFMQIF